MNVEKIIKSIYYQPYIQNTFLKVISPIFPEPENRADAELLYGVWNTTSNLFQTNGRQLGEANVHQGFRFRQIPIEYRQCKIQGSRFGKKTNLTALQDIMRNYKPAMKILALLRQHFVEVSSLESQAFNVGVLFQFTQHVVSLPLFMVRDKSNSQYNDSVVDEEVAVLFQLVAGVFKLARLLLEDHNEKVGLNDIVDAEFLYKYSEKHGLFGTPSAKKEGEEKVCGGSHVKIIELLDFLIRGDDADVVFTANETALKERGVDIDKYLSYSLAALQLEMLVNQCRLESVAHILSIGIVDNNKSQQLHLQTVLNNSEFSQYFVDAFSSVEQNNVYMSAVKFRVAIGREILSRILSLRNSLTKESKKILFFSTELFHDSNVLDNKFPFDVRAEVYKKEACRLQSTILDILSSNKRVMCSGKLLTRRLSLFY